MEAIGPRPKQDPLTLLRETEKFHLYLQPERGEAKKIFSNTTRLRQGRKSWEQHRLVNHDLLVPTAATSITRRDMSVILILDLCSAIMMLLRNKRCAKSDDDYYPLSKQDFFIKNGRNQSTMDTNEILDQLKLAIEYEIPDGGESKPRNGRFDDF